MYKAYENYSSVSHALDLVSGFVLKRFQNTDITPIPEYELKVTNNKTTHIKDENHSRTPIIMPAKSPSITGAI